MRSHIYRMDLRRCFSPLRMGLIILGVTALCFAGAWETISFNLSLSKAERVNAISLLAKDVLFIDAYKIVMVFLLAAIYTGSFCGDDSYHYLRMILTRTTLLRYTVSRFIIHFLGIIAAAAVSFYLFILLLAVIGFPVNSDFTSFALYYKTVAYSCPLLYVGMMGLQFGVIAAACCSVGLLLSSYQPEIFVCIGISGLTFFLLLSYFPDTPFNMLNLISMLPPAFLGSEASQALSFAWGMLYPGAITVLSGMLFYRRMKWRVCNGFI